MANILLVTHWTGGDVIPFIRMGSILKKRGHDVRLFTHCIYDKDACSAGLEFTALDTPEEYQRMVDDLILLSDPIHNLEGTERFNKNYHGSDKILSEYQIIKDFCQRDDTVLICRHRSSISALLAAEKHHLPVASVFLAPNYMSHLSLHESLMGDMMAKEINKARSELDLVPINSWTSWMCSPKRIIGMWPEWFAKREPDWPESLVTIDFPHMEDDHAEPLPETVLPLLDPDHKPILITAGTSKMIKPEFYQVAQEACHNLNYKAILVTQYAEHIPQPLHEGIHVFQYLPLKQLMPHVGAIIHHGGIGTLSEAVNAGIPQLVLPYYADRPDNAFRLSELGVAEFIPPAKWDPSLLSSALERLMSPESIHRCLKLSDRARNQNTALKLCEVIESMVSNSHYLLKEESIEWDKGVVDTDKKKNNTMNTSQLTAEKKQLIAQLLRNKVSQ